MRLTNLIAMITALVVLTFVLNYSDDYLLGQFEGILRQPLLQFQQGVQSPQSPAKEKEKGEGEIDNLRNKLAHDPNKARRDLAAQLKDYIVERSDHFVLLYKPAKTAKERKEQKEYAKEVLALMELELEKCVIDFKCERPKERMSAIILERKEFVAVVGRRDITAGFSRNLRVVFFQKGIVSDNDLSHEIFHLVIEPEKKRLFGGNFFLHWFIEEGLGHSRENEIEKEKRLQRSFSLHQGLIKSDFVYSTEEILSSLIYPKGITNQQESDIRVQVTSLILFLLDRGVPPRELLVLGKDVFEAYKKNKDDVDKAAREAEQIVREFLKKYGIDYRKLDREWLDWEKKKARQ